MSKRNGQRNLHTVTRDDPPFLFHCGEGYERHRLPVGATVIYPNAPLAPLPDARAAIIQAIDHPEGMEPLDAHLTPGMSVTIAFDDVSLPLPRMARPDIRQTIIEVVLERLDRAGVTDIELICAICLHRRCTPAELKHFVGSAIFNRFWPDRLYNHDAEDPAGNVHLGVTDTGEDVEINRRAVESDLLVYVNINLATMDGGHKSVPVGLATYKSVRHHHNAATMLHESSYMDPERSIFHRSCDRMGAVVKKHIKIFTIETSLNGDTFHNLLGFLQKRESAWNVRDRLSYHGSRVGLKLLPASLRRKAYSALPAPYGLTGAHAGDTQAVHVKTLENVYRQQLVTVPEAFDIAIVGLPSIGPYNVNSILNPILVHCLALGYFFNFFREHPYIRKGGVMILTHPIEHAFNLLHHPSYFDFFENAVCHTRDPKELERRFEKSYAESDWYRHLYRHSYAYHGVHPFYMWYWAAHGAAHLGKVIAVRPKGEAAARRLGYDVAPTLAAAIGEARDYVGRDARMCYFHCPPIMITEIGPQA
ncbi:MAG: lactate racemase domain-containing protein [Phycisphaerae bacterium]